AGRWSRIVRPTAAPAAGTPEEAALAEKVLDQLLRRYGILFRATVERERLPVSWYAILQAARRWEARGLARGGRFVSGFPGEQFALPAAVEALRAVRRLPAPADLSPLAPSDPFFTLAPATSGPDLAAAVLASPISPLPALAVP
ncbi:MAG: Lhr family helicase, partial [Terriglobales bacterium]